ncbi:hypothetical protein [Diaphorobacter nitroreducens]|uniref:DUF5983 family protein n=1 Tax=Diaphorobacter nitroreducens TaxID=164759 RepID=UPI001E301099|nr:hypothetical protein [Diaphorobacter nitroreducens]
MNQVPPIVSASVLSPVQSTGDTDAQLASLRRSILACAEPMVALSTEHLHPDTRLRLAKGALSVVTYPNEYGGFVYVGTEGGNTPSEPELAAIFEVVRDADIVWIKFDRDTPVVEGLPTFEDPPWV